MRMNPYEFSPEAKPSEEVDTVTVTLRIPISGAPLLVAFQAIDDLGKKMTELAFVESGKTMTDETLDGQFVDSLPPNWQRSMYSLKTAFNILHRIAIDTMNDEVDTTTLAGQVVRLFFDLTQDNIDADELHKKLADILSNTNIDAVALELTDEQARVLNEIRDGVSDPSTPVLAELGAIITAAYMSDQQKP